MVLTDNAVINIKKKTSIKVDILASFSVHNPLQNQVPELFHICKICYDATCNGVLISVLKPLKLCFFLNVSVILTLC